MAKSERTFGQVETAKDRAVNFMQNVLNDNERADEIENESVEDYAERRRILIVNPASVEKLTNFLIEKLERIEQLEQMVFEAVETIDETDQSRQSLSNSIDKLRDVLTDGYGEDLEDDFQDHLDSELPS